MKTPILIVQEPGRPDEDTVPAKQRYQLIPLPDPLPHAVVVERDLLLQQRTTERLCLMDGLQVASAIKVRQLASIDRVVFVAVPCDPMVPTWLADHQLVDTAAKLPRQPVRQRPFLESQSPRPTNLANRLP